MPTPKQLRNLLRGPSALERTRLAFAKKGRNPNGSLLWTEAELADCRRIYPNYRALEVALPRRTTFAIQIKCRDLGLNLQGRRAWTGAEIARLRRLYPIASHSDLLAAFPGRSFEAIKSAANDRQFHRVKPKYVPTGHPLLDEVRQRCYDLNLTMRDLDAMAGTGSYFRNSGWLSTRRIHPAMVRAALALAGVVKVEWPE